MARSVVRWAPPSVGHLAGKAARYGAVAVAGGALAVLTLAAGCATAIRWEGPTYLEARVRARERGQLAFVYFRSWYLVECTDFEERILKSHDVVAESRALTCVVLDLDWDKPLAQEWSLDVVPAFAIVSPDGEVLAKQHAPITHAELIEALRAARAKHATTAPSTAHRGPFSR